MVDKVKPLKIEDTTSGGDLDMMPKELDPAEDYVSVKGVALENSDSTLIDLNTNEIQFTDSVSGSKKVSDLLDADQEDFDPGSTDLTSTKTGPAIRELRDKVTSSASPGFSFGASGNNSSGTWLRRVGNIPTNKTGIPIRFSNPELTRITSGTEDTNTYTIEVYEHSGDSVGLTLLTSLSVTSSRNGDSGAISIAATTGKQLAVKISSGSAKNIGVDIDLIGDNT